MLEAQNISKSYHGHDVITKVSLKLHKGQRLAIIGPNGVGKSTLLKILAGIEEPDTGSVVVRGSFNVVYLPQELKIDSAETISVYLEKITGIKELEGKLRVLEEKLDSAEKLETYGEFQEKFSSMDGYAFEHRMSILLEGFGFKGDYLNRPINSLSGGQKTKVLLTGLLLQNADFYLLDEPTNNLDLPSIIWLEMFLQTSKSGFLIVSHDRRFLDKVVRNIYNIDWYKRTLSEFTGTYSEFINYRDKRIRKEEEQKRIQHEEINRIQESIGKKKQWSARGSYQVTSDKDKYVRGYRRDRSSKMARGAKSLEKKLERMDLVELTRERPKLEIPLVPHNEEAKHAISLHGAKVVYPSFILGPISLFIKYGSKIGIIGTNGSGKTTLLKLITEDVKPSEGEVNKGKGLIIGNLMQCHENLVANKSIFQYLKENSNLEEHLVFLTLTKFHFGASDSDKLIGVLSPGERARLLLALFSANSVNTLVLDEPTNHLDIEAIEALEYALKDYTGTVIFVSHDRHFLEVVNPNSLFLLDNGVLNAIDSYRAYVELFTSISKNLIRNL